LLIKVASDEITIQLSSIGLGKIIKKYEMLIIDEE
jgi:hypothetical protein